LKNRRQKAEGKREDFDGGILTPLNSGKPTTYQTRPVPRQSLYVSCRIKKALCPRTSAFLLREAFSQRLRWRVPNLSLGILVVVMPRLSTIVLIVMLALTIAGCEPGSEENNATTLSNPSVYSKTCLRNRQWWWLKTRLVQLPLCLD